MLLLTTAQRGNRFGLSARPVFPQHPECPSPERARCVTENPTNYSGVEPPPPLGPSPLVPGRHPPSVGVICQACLVTK